LHHNDVTHTTPNCGIVLLYGSPTANG